jgi:hypothetical protein
VKRHLKTEGQSSQREHQGPESEPSSPAERSAQDARSSKYFADVGPSAWGLIPLSLDCEPHFSWDAIHAIRTEGRASLLPRRKTGSIAWRGVAWRGVARNRDPDKLFPQMLRRSEAASVCGTGAGLRPVNNRIRAAPSRQLNREARKAIPRNLVPGDAVGRSSFVGRGESECARCF